MERNIVSGVLSVVSAKVVTMLIGLVTSPLLYRMLGPTKFGEYATVLSAHAMFMIFVSAGITRGVRKYVAEDRYLPDWEDRVVGFYFRLAVALAAAGALVYLLAVKSGVIAWLFDPTFETYFTLMIGAVVSAQLWSFARRALMGFGLEHHSEPLTVVYWVTFAGVALGLVSLGYGVAGALAGQILGTLVVGLVGMVLVVRRVSPAALVRTSPATLPRRKMLVYNANTIALSFLLLSLYHVDVVMLQAMREGPAVGHYKAALKLAEFLWFVPVTIQSVYVHSTSELWSKGAVDRIASIAAKTTRYTLLLTGIMVLGLASLADLVVPLYWGQEATPAIEPLVFLLPGALGFAAVRPTLAIEGGHGTLRHSLKATAAAAAMNLALNAALIPRFGTTGAAVATSVGYGSMFVFHVWSARKLGFDPIADARLVRLAVTAAVAAVPVFWLPGVLPGRVLPLVVVPPVGLAVFLAMAFLTGALEREECLDLLSAFPGPVPRAAERLRSFEFGLPTSTRAAVDGQRWLVVLGVLLFVTGTGFAFVTAALDGGGSAADPADATATPAPAETVTPTPGGGETGVVDAGDEPGASPPAGDSGDPSDDGGGGPADRDGGPDDDGSDRRGSGDRSDDDDPADEPDDPTDDESEDTDTDTDTETDTETESDTPTDTETDTPTETNTTTETETDTSTETETNVTTETDTETETNTTTETDTETETATDTETDTPTDTETDTGTETDTPTDTESDTPTDTETATDTETETDTDTPTDAESDTPTDAESDTGSSTDPSTGGDTSADDDSDASSDTGGDGEATATA